MLPDGTAFDGVDGLKAALVLARPDRFVGTLTDKLLTYALGRGLEHYDMPAVRAIVREASAQRLPDVVPHTGHREEPPVSRTAHGRSGVAAGRRALTANWNSFVREIVSVVLTG